MHDAKAKALAIYGANVRETRRHFTAMEDALRAEYLGSDMAITTFDQRLAAIRDELAYFLAAEVELYHLNCSHPLPVAA